MQRRCSHNEHTLLFKRTHHIRDKKLLLCLRDVLYHITGVGGVECARNWAGKHVMNSSRELPATLIHPRIRVFHEYWIKVDSSDSAHLLLHYPSSECVTAAYLQHALLAAKHFRNELVSSQD